MKNSLRVFLIVLVLALIVALPPLATGFQSSRLGQAALDAGQPLEAAAHFQRAARLLPWQPGLWQRAGLAALQGQDFALARRCFLQAQRKGALDAEAQVAYGETLWQLGERDAARAAWETLRAGGIQTALLLDRLAAIYESEGRLGAAIEARRAQLSLDAGDADARLRLGLMLAARADPDAINELVRAAQDDPALAPTARSVRIALNTGLLQADPAYQLVSVGRGLGEAGEWALAQSAFVSAVESNRAYAEAWAWLGEARQQRGFDDGGQYVEYAYRLDPRSTMVLLLYALYRQRGGDTALALRAYEAVAQSDPANPLWWATLAAAQAQDGQLQPALESYRQAIALRPEDPAYYKLLAGFCADYDFQVLEVGARAAVKARNLAPADPETRVLQARLMLLSGYESASIKLLEQAFALDPQNAAAHYYLGFIYFNRNEMESARQYLAQAAALDPNGSIGTQARNILERYFP